MHPAGTFRVLGVLLMLFSVSMLVPAGVSLLYRDGATTAFLLAFAITLFTGLACWLPTRKQRAELRIRDGFLVTVLFWAVLGLYGSFPLMLSDQPELSITDAVFESLSRLDHDRCHGHPRPRRPTPLYPVIPPATPVVGRHGHHRPRHCRIAHARHSVACSFFAPRSPAPLRTQS